MEMIEPIKNRLLNRLAAYIYMGLCLIGSQSVVRLNRLASLKHNFYCMGHFSPYRVLGWVSSVQMRFPKGTDDVLNRLKFVGSRWVEWTGMYRNERQLSERSVGVAVLSIFEA